MPALRRHALTLTLACGLFALHSVHADDSNKGGEGGDRGRGGDDERVRKGFAIAPVKLNLRGKDRDLVGLGSYLVNAGGGCNDCHTQPNFAPGGDPFEGKAMKINTEQYMAGGRVFGPVTSENITPDADGKPAGLSFAQFKSMMRTGEDPNEPGEIVQVMPWPVYGQLTDRDLRAIYEYLSAIPSLENNPHPSP